MPKIRWRLYPFKGEEALRKALQTSCSGKVHATHPLLSPAAVLYIHRQSAYLIGRDRQVWWGGEWSFWGWEWGVVLVVGESELVMLSVHCR